MPFAIRKKGRKFLVVNKDTGKVHGTHDTRAEAVKQLRALYANVPDAKMTAHFSKWTKAKRDALSLADYGDPTRKLFPVEDQDDLDSAAHLIGKAKSPEAVRKRLIGIAKRKGLALPAAWQSKGKGKDPDAAMSAGPFVVVEADASAWRVV